MKRQVQALLKRLFLSLLLVVPLLVCTLPDSMADSPIRLLVDGKDITASAAPVIQNGRTLVPVRFVSEELGAEVFWNNDDRTVLVTKGDRSVLLRIDSHLVDYSNPIKTYGLCDVAPTIINDRTFVPLRLVGNALGVEVGWEDSSRTVYVDSTKNVGIASFFDMRIASTRSGQSITGPTALQAVFPGGIPSGATEFKFMIVTPGSATGTVVARGSQPEAIYQWLPDLRDNGSRILIAAAYDANGRFLAGDNILINVAVVPKVSLTGVTVGQIVSDSISIGAAMNFSAAYVQYEITNLDNGKVFTSPESDPRGQYKWSPLMEDAGNLSIKAKAFDQSGQFYVSAAVLAQASVSRKLALAGVKAGETIDGPVTLSVSRNFQVSGTEYVMIDPVTGVETMLAKVGYVNYKWFPGSSLTGERDLMVRVYDTKGEAFLSSRIRVKLSGKSRLLLEGAGPGQVISGPVTLKATCNEPLKDIKFVLNSERTGVRKTIAGGQDPLIGYEYAPSQGDAGACDIQAVGTTQSGRTLYSEAVPITIFTGKIYPPVPIIEKTQFQELASGLAQGSLKKTGMSAALQTAQAILESGWGQSVPVDKYNGQLSYNLFGIKGAGTAGSVTSNTWEEYNGVAYRIDAEFRAYKSVGESWNDHKKLLLTVARYENFRAVMHDSTQGAWALKRAGYATDSKYPLKLMNIIKLYDLQKLDQIKI